MGGGYCLWLGLTIGLGGHLFLGTGVEKLHFFIGKRKKPPVVGRRNAENDEKGLSSADDRGKTRKTAHRRPTKRKKQQKLPVVGRRNAELRQKLCFGAPRRVENGKNCVSGHPDGQKNGKNRSDTGVNRPFLPKNRVSP